MHRASPFTHGFPLVHRAPLGVGYHYPHRAAEESQGSQGLTLRAAVFPEQGPC